MTQSGHGPGLAAKSRSVTGGLTRERGVGTEDATGLPNLIAALGPHHGVATVKLVLGELVELARVRA
jgi:hypothetical protein